MTSTQEVYIGDGIYASVVSGDAIKLRVKSEVGVDSTILLSAKSFANLIRLLNGREWLEIPKPLR